MNIPLYRLIEGIIATMRSDVIPHVSDSYARGQAVGVIDLLNNIAPRVEWAQAPLARLVQAHLHDEMAAEMKITRKPLFAEIASGGDGAKG